jgi:hypothetical protein
MSRDRSMAMFARIGSYGKFAAALIRHLRTLWDAPVCYRRGGRSKPAGHRHDKGALIGSRDFASALALRGRGR